MSKKNQRRRGWPAKRTFKDKVRLNRHISDLPVQVLIWQLFCEECGFQRGTPISAQRNQKKPVRRMFCPYCNETQAFVAKGVE